LGNDGAQWKYALDGAASATKITIKNSSGVTVFSANGETKAGPHTFAWDGKTSAGDDAPDGNYTLSVKSTAIDGEDVSTFVTVKGLVKAVDLSTGTPMVETDVGVYLLESVLRVDA